MSIENPAIDHILSKVLVDTAGVGLNVVGFMFQDYKNIETFKAWCLKEKLIGYRSKACMGPAQVEIANEIFGDDPNKRAKAREIIRVFEEHSARGENGFMHPEYGFVDEPVYKDALLVMGSDANI